MSDRAFAAVFGVFPEQLTPLRGGYGDEHRISPTVLKEFVRLSLKNHGPTMRRIADNSRPVDERLMRRLYMSFVDNLEDARVSKLLERNRRAYDQ